MAKADAALAKHAYPDALKAYRRANSHKDDKSPEALHGMARSHLGLGAHAKVVDTCEDTLKYVGDNRGLEASSRNLRAMSLIHLSVKPDDQRLARAEVDLRAALQLGAPGVEEARYNLGYLLLRTNRDDDGIAVLREYPRTCAAISHSGRSQTTHRESEARTRAVRTRLLIRNARRPADFARVLTRQDGATRLLGHMVPTLPRRDTRSRAARQETRRASLRHRRNQLG